MRPQDTAYIIERLAVRFMAMVADHEAKMVEHRAAFGVRTEADAKIIAGLRKARDGLLTQVQDMRAEMARLSAQLEWERAEIKRLQWENATMHKDAEDGYAEAIKVLGDPIALSKERDALRADVKDLRTLCDQWKQRETELQAEIERLKKPERKHPVAVGEWVRRTGNFCHWGRSGEVAQVQGIRGSSYRVQRQCGDVTDWDIVFCEPCDPPEATHDTAEGRSVSESVIRDDRKTEPKPGDVVRLVRIPSRADVSPELQTNLEWPWLERWGTLNQTAMVVKPAHQLAGAVPVCLSTNVRARWPICCVEVVRTEPDEIKVGDVVEVFRDSSGNTLKTDVGIIGKVLKLYSDFIDGERLVMLDPESQNRQSEGGCHYALCDVRKVTT